jgi:hypothetical protein
MNISVTVICSNVKVNIYLHDERRLPFMRVSAGGNIILK